ncbi:barstar family protein [Arthrobacter sp. AK01]|nr:barstar family protein [Arthrobacter sp. AK01]MCP1412317.1 hypothetical protein [Paenarthrobacter sp. A20]
MDEFGAALQFPRFFGENWPALDECLNDLDWLLPAGALVLIIQDASVVLANEDQKELHTLTGVLKTAVSTFAEPIALGEAWDRPAVPFYVVLQAEQTDEQITAEKWGYAGAKTKAVAI